MDPTDVQSCDEQCCCEDKNGVGCRRHVLHRQQFRCHGVARIGQNSDSRQNRRSDAHPQEPSCSQSFRAHPTFATFVSSGVNVAGGCIGKMPPDEAGTASIVAMLLRIRFGSPFLLGASEDYASILMRGPQPVTP